MQILIAPDSFKHSLGAADVAALIKQGFNDGWPQAQCVCLPLADGGEGTVSAIVQEGNGDLFQQDVQDPLGRSHQAVYARLSNGEVVIELAQASGIQWLQPGELNPLCASSYGTGQLISAALAHKPKRLILALGGSACNDAGAGMLTALGVRLLDAEGQSLPPGGAALARLHRIDSTGLDPRILDCELLLACDVDNPLLGPNGASAVYGPQKGADADMVAELDASLTHFADVLVDQGYRDMRQVSGAGAAGGTAFGALSLLGARLVSGADWILTRLKVEEQLGQVDLLITGEGSFDAQTLRGKAPMALLKLAQRAGVPIIGIGGCLGHGYQALLDAGFTALYGTQEAGLPLAEIQAKAREALYLCALKLARELAAKAAAS
ncbi:glycerate kinase [Shewanella cyperi]|uniref:glycerate kinase n=1 Tax=Shewanella cyperi TaxID=2814292 RepID=UPI001A941234|nr:glycerate kinase [Shewanella cyperi]QSX41996.1 glycerate kinase [Shewanella cyperi]